MIYELFLEGKLADTRQDLGMQLNYNIDDINKYGSRDTSFSKTIVLPGTAKNNKIFGFVGELGSNNPYEIGDANINANFNVAQTTKAELRANGLLLLKGVFRLTGILRERDMIEYEGNLFGELGGFIAAIGASKLEDLDFSLYNHSYTTNNIINSWDNKITKNVNGLFSTLNDIIIIDIFYDLDISAGDIIIIDGATDSNNNDTYLIESINISNGAYIIEVNKNLTTRLGDSFTITYTAASGKGYYYPLIDYGTYSSDKINYDYRTFRPALYVIEYINKIFLNSGYTYKSNFFDNEFFKKLILPNNAKELRTLSNRFLQINTSAAAGINDYILFFDINNFIRDFSSIDGKTYTYNGSSSFKPLISLNITNFSLSTFVNNEFKLKIVLKVTAGATITRYGLNGNNDLTSYDYIIPEERKTRTTESFNISFSGNDINFGGTGNLDFQPKVGSKITISNTVQNNNTYTVSSVNIILRVITVEETFVTESSTAATINYVPNQRTGAIISLSDYIKSNLPIDVTIANNNQIAIEVYSINFTDSIIAKSSLELFSQIPISTQALLNDEIFINDITPRNILQKDFFVWIMKMFNLYITEDKIKEKHLLIEPYVEYYNLSDTIDWTYKVARNKQWNIKPMGMLNGRFFEYKYKDDNDFYNEGYKKKYNLPYGSRLEDTFFQFAKDKQTIEIGFSSTPLIQYQGTDKVVSAIYKKSSGNSVDQEERMDSNIRILLAKKITEVDSWAIINTGSSQTFPGTALSASLNEYGYAGHFDDPINPIKDINFGASSEIYFDPITYPTNNLFNDYWSDYIAEIADKDSKLFTCHVYLNDLDIAQLDFSKPVFIDGVLWRINKVMDYDSTSGELTKVELLKVINTFNPILLCANNWTKENYKGTTYRNGDQIFQATNSQEWIDAAKLGIGAWCYYNFDSNNNNQYGKLYNWYALNDIREFAPIGYRVPSISDWNLLIECLGGSDIAGGKMKKVDIWDSPNTNATNKSGFNGVPSGGGSTSLAPVVLNFSELNRFAYYWASDNLGGSFAQIYILRYDEGTIDYFETIKEYAFSIRLIKEN